jgi:hypothetical protein
VGFSLYLCLSGCNDLLHCTNVRSDPRRLVCVRAVSCAGSSINYWICCEEGSEAWPGHHRVASGGQQICSTAVWIFYLATQTCTPCFVDIAFMSLYCCIPQNSPYLATSCQRVLAGFRQFSSPLYKAQCTVRGSVRMCVVLLARQSPLALCCRHFITPPFSTESPRQTDRRLAF